MYQDVLEILQTYYNIWQQDYSSCSGVIFCKRKNFLVVGSWDFVMLD